MRRLREHHARIALYQDIYRYAIANSEIFLEIAASLVWTSKEEMTAGEKEGDLDPAAT